MSKEKIIINEDSQGTFTAVVYDGKMRIFLKQNIASKVKALSEVRKFLKEQDAMIESGELIALL